MSKLWSEPRRIEIYKRTTKEMVKTFVADDAHSCSPINTFYLNGKEVGHYNEREFFYKSFDIEETD